jgi:DNA anti-recombination protein RmuC
LIEIILLSLIILGILGILINSYLSSNSSNDVIDEQRIRELATLMATEIAKVERDELKRENETHAEKLENQYVEKKKAMDKEVDLLKNENITLKTLVDTVAAAQKMTADAVNATTDVSQRVANALGGNDPHVKKEYGEGRAENILTIAGFREGEHFLKQPPLVSGEIPDLVLLLPGGGAVAIDCKAIIKAGFNAFYEIDEVEDTARKKKLLGDHARNIWDTVKELASRNYPLGLEQQFGKGPDYTLMFIPNEEFYYRAEIGVSDTLRKNMGYPTLREAAIRKGVFFCSPDSLAMRSIELFDQWKTISALDEMNDVLEMVQDVTEAIVRTEESKAEHHKALEKAIKSWNSHVNEIESTHTGRKDPSLRVAITNLFKVVSAKSTFSTVHGKKGSKAEPIPLKEIPKLPNEPTTTDLKNISLDSRIEKLEAME